MGEVFTGPARPLRCAIYTRKSTEEGLDQAFNSLQAQREAAEAYILSQRQAGWVALPEHYDDGGFSGASLDRPALQRLLAAIPGGTLDCVLVYKVDRLSRSLLDFARLMEQFDRAGVCFVSVTQEFNTTTSLGRLTLNILLSFAQFEREIISERTRDKVSAARRKGKWIGGWPVLGYSVDPNRGGLLVHPEEALQVREMFLIAAQKRTLEEALRVIQARGFTTKIWTSQAGKYYPGRPFSRMTLRHTLSNRLYTGAVGFRGTVYPGEQERIVEQELWERVNAKLELRSGQQRGRRHQKQAAPLAGLLYCSDCGSGMLPTFTVKAGKRYEYYSCHAAHRAQPESCRQLPVAARDLEGSILRNLEPSFGPEPSWTAIQPLIERVTYLGTTRKVIIALRDGARLEYGMRLPNRRGVVGSKPETETGRVPRVSRLMALAIKFERLVREGAIRHFRDIARAGHISGARMSQIMRLTDLAPSIQEELLFLPKTVQGPDRITERALREIAKSVDWERQLKMFRSRMDASESA